MELRSRTRLQLRRAAMTAALGALLVPATAGAATKPPVISKVTPKSVKVGDTLTISGKYFRKGKGKNKVMFKRDKGPALFVKAGLATGKSIKVTIPAQLEKYMSVKNGQAVPTRFRLRVLSTKLSKAYTSVGRSPMIGPKAGGDGSGAGSCNTSNAAADNDGDGLNNGLEISLKTEPCNADTDGDSITDGYEYWSALDLNQGNAALSIPYPGRKPYPNPLDASDANKDHDGDVLTLYEEFRMWQDPRGGNKQPWPNLGYSDGKQATVAVNAPADGDQSAAPNVIWANDPTMRFLDANGDGLITPAELAVLDFNADATVSDSEFQFQDLNDDGKLTDDERDLDGDGMTNYDETHGRLTPGYWSGAYDKEPSYAAFVAFEAPDAFEADSDGDGINDGLDDQDDDGFRNVDELSRGAAQTVPTPPFNPPFRLYGQVNPFNPCLPATATFDAILNPGSVFSPDCMRHPPFKGGPAPFDDTSPKYPAYLVNND
jgi:hypothetical protein